MVERVFVEVVVTLETPNTRHVRREVGWSLASLGNVSYDRLVVLQGSNLGQRRRARPISSTNISG